VILLDGVWKSYGETVALREVSFTVGPGEVCVLTGPSGAGKSTLLRMLYAAERADAGRVEVAGHDLASLARARIPRLRREVGVVFQDFKLLADRSVRENVAIALEIRHVRRREVRRRVDAALSAVGLLPRGEARVRHLSGGEQQRVAVARAVVGEPEIVLADEPTGNLDPDRASELLMLFETLRRRGTTMIVATHDPGVICFAAAHGWRRVRLDAGTVVDLGDEVVPELLNVEATAPEEERGGNVIPIDSLRAGRK
jgi:cell division transport system ATP-binding protein